jgi:hypothetical protein
LVPVTAGDPSPKSSEYARGRFPASDTSKWTVVAKGAGPLFGLAPIATTGFGLELIESATATGDVHECCAP